MCTSTSHGAVLLCICSHRIGDRGKAALPASERRNGRQTRGQHTSHCNALPCARTSYVEDMELPTGRNNKSSVAQLGSSLVELPADRVARRCLLRRTAQRPNVDTKIL